MITFGQGLNRAHPNLIKIVNSIEKGDDVKGFMHEVRGFLGHLGVNTARSLGRLVTRPRSKANLESYYEVSSYTTNF